jgi:hypothetical protein
VPEPTVELRDHVVLEVLDIAVPDACPGGDAVVTRW